MLRNYDVFHWLSNVGMGPFSKAYGYLGKVHQLYTGGYEPPPPITSMREARLDRRTGEIRSLCGYGAAIHEIYAMASHLGGLDVYVQTVGEKPLDAFSHYRVDIAEPCDWWMSRGYEFVGVLSMPEWAPTALPRAAM